LGRGAGSPFNTKSPGPRPSDMLIRAAIWQQQIWADNWGVSLWRGGAGSPSNTMWPGPRPTCMQSFTLIRPIVWPQCTNVTDRQTGQDRQRSDSMGRTVLQTVAQKLNLNQQLTVRTVHMCLPITVNNCRTQHSTEQF